MVCGNRSLKSQYNKICKVPKGLERGGQSFLGFRYLEDRRSVKGGGHRKRCWSCTALVDDGAGCHWFADDVVSSSLGKATQFEKVKKKFKYTITQNKCSK